MCIYLLDGLAHHLQRLFSGKTCIEYFLDGLVQEKVSCSATEADFKDQARGEADIKKWLDSDDLFDIAPPKKPSTDACADKSILAWMAEFQIPVTEPAAVVGPFMECGETTTRTSSRWAWGTGEPLPW